MSLDLDDQLERDGEWKESAMGFQFDAFGYDDESRYIETERSDGTQMRFRQARRGSNGDKADRGEQILDALAQERDALQDALARNAVARAKIQAQQEQKLMMGQEDIFENGDVIRWKKRFRNRDGSLGEQSYTYAALKAGGKWYTTGSTARSGAAHGRTWAGLLAFMIARGEVTEAYVMEVIPGRKLV